MQNLKYLSFILVFLSVSTFAQSKKPNIIVIMIDDMGWRDVGFMGSKYYETPNIDALASKGMVFTDAYASAANCAPSRASLMSGQWTPRHGIYTVGTSARGQSRDRKLIPIKNNEYIPKDNLLIPKVLRDAGYITCHAGKWHLSDNPITHGFDVNIGGNHAGNPGSYYPPYKKVPLEAPTDDKYLTELIMDRTLDFVKTTNKKPFFLYYSPYAVHTPIQSVKSLLSKYDNKTPWNGQNNSQYATMVENLDIQIGRLITVLRTLNKLENTLVLFSSDNGGVYTITKQRPLRAGKGSYYEGGIREPLFAFWHNQIEAGTKSDYPVSNLDFYPTILEAAGINVPMDKVLDGQSIMPLLVQGKKLKERPLFWHFPIYLESGNEDSQDPLFRCRPGSAIRLGNWKLIEYFENNDFELYNLKNDIGERINLINSHPNKAQKLLTILTNWRKEVNAVVPTELNPKYVEDNYN
ncbi:MAG: sulfatase [Arenibacter algicola]